MATWYQTIIKLSDVAATYFEFVYDLGESCTPQTTTYTYDIANRLTSSTGHSYTWDDNGNLLADGTKSYAYDSANRLTRLSGGGSTTTYQYNGLGDRLQETMGGVSTNFSMDLNTGLTQVLADGTNTYLYGNERISQWDGAEHEYFLGDALGSVRQLADEEAVTLAKAYEPYGEVLSQDGGGASYYGYTGEWTSQELIYLRSRMYSPLTGLFITKDSWQGVYENPITLNKWLYAHGNPTNLTDPSGEDPFSQCATLLLAFAAADGPLPAGEAAGVLVCLYIFGSAWYGTWLMSQLAPDLAEVGETLADRCLTWERISNLPTGTPQPTPRPTPQPQPLPYSNPQPTPEKTPDPKYILYHYSTSSGIAGILSTLKINPSLDDKYAVYGPGQYFTDISPTDASIGNSYQLARALYRTLFRQTRVTDYIAVDLYGLPIEKVASVYSRTYGDKYIYLHWSMSPLPIQDRIVSTGKVPFSK